MLHSKEKINEAVIKSSKENITTRLFYMEKQHDILQHQLQIRTLLLVLFFGIFVVSFFTYVLLYSPISKIDSGPFVTQNLRGDLVDTWLYWNIVDHNSTLHIHIINDAKIDENKIQMIHETILSTDSIQINDLLLHKGPAGQFSNFYKGWLGAMNTASSVDTKYPIPTNFHVHKSSSNDGDITITLTKSKSMEGYSGYTKSLLDGNQIIKSYITIYQADILTESKITTIVRHELGHAIGLIHSTDPNDLTHDTISTYIPYISECTIEALRELYNGNTSYT